jgi:hypothetical protein
MVFDVTTPLHSTKFIPLLIFAAPVNRFVEAAWSFVYVSGSRSVDHAGVSLFRQGNGRKTLAFRRRLQFKNDLTRVQGFKDPSEKRFIHPMVFT